MTNEKNLAAEVQTTKKMVVLALVLSVAGAGAGLYAATRERRYEGQCCSDGDIKDGQFHKRSGVWHCDSATECG
jgi:hypothetical protein